ncbi:hypothetical protein HPB47_027541 [Ixodes persulcatus]|uniref:Uncharacterized protein n=1 Tax=Ixodes persulcatus TaxID=34615 RepID=A0AC60PVK6_IXOPE|nr:hypothetical protein HPB47_027541 [Ixodes persulcatus]
MPFTLQQARSGEPSPSPEDTSNTEGPVTYAQLRDLFAEQRQGFESTMAAMVQAQLQTVTSAQEDLRQRIIALEERRDSENRTDSATVRTFSATSNPLHCRGRTVNQEGAKCDSRALRCNERDKKEGKKKKKWTHRAPWRNSATNLCSAVLAQRSRSWLHYFSPGRGAIGAEMRSDCKPKPKSPLRFKQPSGTANLRPGFKSTTPQRQSSSNVEIQDPPNASADILTKGIKVGRSPHTRQMLEALQWNSRSLRHSATELVELFRSTGRPAALLLLETQGTCPGIAGFDDVWQRYLRDHLLMPGDFNAHHPDSGCSAANTRGARLQEAEKFAHLPLTNDLDYPTRHGLHECQRDSASGMTWVDSLLVANWWCEPDPMKTDQYSLWVLFSTGGKAGRRLSALAIDWAVFRKAVATFENAVSSTA